MDTLPLVAPEQVGLSAARLDRVRKWMNGWVDSGRLAGMTAVVMRKGELAFAETCGRADIERNKPMRPDTIFRIYSMTKPLTSTAIMMLYEEGRFQLDDPISKFIPAFANPRVYAGGSRGKIDSTPAEREINFRDLLTHTSGLTLQGQPRTQWRTLTDRTPAQKGRRKVPLRRWLERKAGPQRRESRRRARSFSKSRARPGWAGCGRGGGRDRPRPPGPAARPARAGRRPGTRG